MANAIDFTTMIKNTQIKMNTSAANVASNASFRRSTSTANEPEQIGLVQVGRNSANQTCVYAITGGWSVEREVVMTKQMEAKVFVETPTREEILRTVCEAAVSLINASAKEGRKTNLRMVMYDGMAIKHFSMISANRDNEDPVERMCTGRDGRPYNYSDEIKKALAEYVQAVNSFRDITGKNLFVETYKSQLFWDIIVPDDCKDKIEAGTVLKFRDNECTNVKGIHFAQEWHRGNAQYRAHLDMNTKFDEEGNPVMDENGNPIREIRSYSVVRPTIQVGEKTLPKNAKARFVIDKLAGYAKANLPVKEITVLEGDEAEAAMADFM